MKCLVCCGLVLAWVGGARAELGVGDAAPAIEVSSWVQGKPVKNGAGRVRVVDFWGTWYAPSQESGARLSRLATSFAGKVDVVGVDVWERGADPRKDVSDFIDSMGGRMSYSVAMDGAAGTMGSSWLSAAGLAGIPAAFVLDKKGTIVWIGDPMEIGPTMLKQVLHGAFDIEKSKAKHARDLEEAKGREALRKDGGEIDLLWAQGKRELASEKLDELLRQYPAAAGPIQASRFTLLYAVDELQAYTFAEELSRGEHPSTDAPALVAIAELFENNPKKADWPRAARYLESANKISSRKDPIALYMLARAYAQLGEFEKATAAIRRGLQVYDRSDYATDDDLRDSFIQMGRLYKTHRTR